MSKKNKDNENTFQETIKIILVGNSGVGKTSIINRYYLNEFLSYIDSTSTMNFIQKNVSIKGKNLLLNIWDTVGQEKYRSCNKLFVKNSNIVIFVYDITIKKSFTDLEFWYNFISNEIGNDLMLGLVGNKFDLVNKEEISADKGKEQAEKWGAYFSLLSAKEDKEGIDRYFEELIARYLDSVNNDFVVIDSNKNIKTIKLDKNETFSDKEENNNCCGGGKNKKGKIKDFKVIFLGSNGVGKTNIIKAIRGKEINQKYEPTKNVTKSIFECSLDNNKKYNIKILDTNGKYINNSEIINIIKSCKIFFLVFDVNKRETFNELEIYINKIKEIHGDNKIPINILGNNNNILEDDEDNNMVTEQEGKEFAEKNGYHYETISFQDIISVQNIIKNGLKEYLN